MHTMKVFVCKTKKTQQTQVVDLQKNLFRNTILFYYYYSTVQQFQTVSSIPTLGNIMTERILRQNTYSTFLTHNKNKYFPWFISRLRRKIHDVSVIQENCRTFGVKQEQLSVLVR